jgi:diaminopimelate decarboxylase
VGIERLLCAEEEAVRAGFEISWINAGGGFGIAYDDSPVPSAGDYASTILPLLEDQDTGLILELGRYLIGPSGCLLTRILDRKQRTGRVLLIADAGMTELVRPALYEAYHRIVPVEESDAEGALLCDVAGPICESTDMLGWRHSLPELDAGDLLAVLDAGAYAMSMSSNYNSRYRPAEVLITGDGGYRLIRRRERPEDLWAAELDTL